MSERDIHLSRSLPFTYNRQTETEKNMKKSIKIESYRQVAPICENPVAQQQTIRVAAYTYVSPVNNDWDDRENSLNNQTYHYEPLISANPNWEYVGLYADDVSGTNIHDRKEFNQMLEDCKNGKVDLIVVKNASCFVNDLVDLLNTLEFLQTLDTPVGVYFEENNINTRDAGGEFVLKILGMFAELEREEIERLEQKTCIPFDSKVF